MKIWSFGARFIWYYWLQPYDNNAPLINLLYRLLDRIKARKQSIKSLSLKISIRACGKNDNLEELTSSKWRWSGVQIVKSKICKRERRTGFESVKIYQSHDLNSQTCDFAGNSYVFSRSGLTQSIWTVWLNIEPCLLLRDVFRSSDTDMKIRCRKSLNLIQNLTNIWSQLDYL